MCAINGFNFKNESLARAMIEATRHRGPDGQGTYADDYISLGHALLAIVDKAAASKQPLVSDDGNHVLVYNGEIFNYQELRQELKNRGYSFSTNTDTEVILKGLIVEGVSFLKKLNGMFALGYYQKSSRTLTLARDSRGIKPLYYYKKGNRIIFSSEKKGILVHDIPRRLDLEAVDIFFDLGYNPGYKTLIKDLYKVCPGEYIVFNLETGEEQHGWLIESTAALEAQSFDPATYRGLLQQSAFDHTMGLRPFGIFLSGGLDSSSLLYELSQRYSKQITTYSTRFDVADSSYNEDADCAKRLSQEFGTRHNELLIHERDFIDAQELVMWAIEEPRYNPSVAAHYLLARYAGRETVVILGGDGGDELWAGYPKHYESKKISARYVRYPHFLMNLLYTLRDKRYKNTDLFYWLRLDRALERWVHLNRISLSAYRGAFRWPRASATLLRYLKSLTIPYVTEPNPDIDNAQLELDRYFWLSDESLLKSDKTAMAFGMEGRFPLLDERIVHYAMSIPSREKLAGNISKYLMRKTYEGVLPDYITRKRKSGWKAPVSIWMNSELGQYVREVLSRGYYDETRNLFDFDLIEKEFLRSGRYTTITLKKFFNIFAFQIWARKFNIKP